MSSLLSCHQISKWFASTSLFEGLSLGLSEGDRMGLIGPNGAGKSTLLRILAGLDTPDEGSVAVARGACVVLIEQEPVFPPESTVESTVRDAVKGRPQWGCLTDVEVDVRVGQALSRAGLDNPGAKVDTLSGGWRKRLAIARAQAMDPDVLLLDEPTNALDFEGIWWLEGVLRSARYPFLMVCHDRSFLQRVVNRVVEVSRQYEGGSFACNGSYSDYLERRGEYLTAQARYKEALASKVRREVEWLSRGPKARTTKAQGRIREAEGLIDELARVSAQSSSADVQVGLELSASGRRTKRLMVLRGLEYGWGEKKLVSDLSMVLSPGMRIGLVGPNGSGKTTLLRMLVGDLVPDAGEITTAEGLKVVYFDQRRESLDQQQTLKQALAPDGDGVIFQGRPIHVAAWAKRFLFKVEDLALPVARLSGGEQARVLLARLMLKEADVLLLDEPTNDLDIATRDLLEENVADFPGAVLLVSHDQYLLERVCTGLLSLDGEGRVGIFADLAQWIEEVRHAGKASRSAAKGKGENGNGKAKAAGVCVKGEAKESRPRPPRLSYLEKKELEVIESRIEEAERDLELAQQELGDPKNATDASALASAYAAECAARKSVDDLYARWEYLEKKGEAAATTPPR